MELSKIKRWDYQHALVILLAGIGSLYFQMLPILLLAALGSFLWLVSKRLSSPSPIGYANATTLFRLGLLLFLGFFFFRMPDWLSLILGIVILILDGIDGYLARRFKETSDFGAYLDMEADTFFVCLFCTYYYLGDFFDAWILLVGYLRYLYVGLIFIFKLQGRTEKSTRFAKTIAVILFSALLMPLVFPPVIYYPTMICAALLVIYSFGLSFWGLLGGE